MCVVAATWQVGEDNILIGGAGCEGGSSRGFSLGTPHKVVLRLGLKEGAVCAVLICCRGQWLDNCPPCSKNEQSWPDSVAGDWIVQKQINNLCCYGRNGVHVDGNHVQN